jgi:tetratricopeptide (TPR) repeat protein
MRRLIFAGALIAAAGTTGLLAQQGQQAQQAKPAQGAPQVPNTKSAAEGQAVIAVFQAQQQNNPDAVIKAAEELVTKYSDTFYKETALTLEANAYQQKKDDDKASVVYERVLEANPKSFQATMSLGQILVSHTRENDLDREEKLTKASKYLNDTIENLKTAPKPNPNLPDQQWEEAKKSYTAESHNYLGMAALTRKKYDVAASEFKAAVDLTPEPAYQVREAMALQNAGKNEEALAIVDKLLSDPSLHPAIKQVAMQVKNAASVAKK